MRKEAYLIAFLLCWIAFLRTDFSPKKLTVSLTEKSEVIPPEEIKSILSQHYHYLGKGRQSFVFESEDGRAVLKFFNRHYIEIPWYASTFPSFFPKEKEKRGQRRDFYLHSYSLAEQLLKEETGLLYVHLGKTDGCLNNVCLVDRASRKFWIDLNDVSFVLQEKGEPFYPSLLKENIPLAIDQFLALIAKRIELGLSDGDHDIEHNFGYLHGKPFHLDPGRLTVCEELQRAPRRKQEWWSATHRFRDWLSEHHPEFLSVFDEKIALQVQ